MCPFKSYILETINEICEVFKITDGTPTEKLKKILEKVKGE
jgi:hypothetical protein